MLQNEPRYTSSVYVVVLTASAAVTTIVTVLDPTAKDAFPE